MRAGEPLRAEVLHFGVEVADLQERRYHGEIAPMPSSLLPECSSTRAHAMIQRRVLVRLEAGRVAVEPLLARYRRRAPPAQWVSTT